MTFSTSDVAVCCSSASDRFTRAPLHLLEQADVLDRDQCLVGEGRSQLDLFICEWSRRATRDHEDADRNPVTQHGHAKGCAKCTQLLRFGGAL